MPPSMYPMCKNCNEGSLVPFFSSDGHNVYFCTNCGIKFTANIQEPQINDQPVFLKKAIYISEEEVTEPEDKPETVKPESEEQKKDEENEQELDQEEKELEQDLEVLEPVEPEQKPDEEPEAKPEQEPEPEPEEEHEPKQEPELEPEPEEEPEPEQEPKPEPEQEPEDKKEEADEESESTKEDTKQPVNNAPVKENNIDDLMKEFDDIGDTRSEKPTKEEPVAKSTAAHKGESPAKSDNQDKMKNIEVYKKLMQKYRSKEDEGNNSGNEKSNSANSQDNCPVCGTELIEVSDEIKNCEKCGYST